MNANMTYQKPSRALRKRVAEAMTWLMAAGVLFSLLYCSSGANTINTTRNVAYDWESTPLHPEYFVYHTSRDSSKLYLKIHSSELLYARKSPEAPFEARLNCEIAVRRNNGSALVFADSLTFTIRDSNPEQDARIILKEFDFSLDTGLYVFEVRLSDRNRRVGIAEDLDVRKTLKGSREDFLIFTEDRPLPLMRNHADSGSKVRVESDRFPGQLQILLWDPEVSLPPPPYTEARISAPEIPAQTGQVVNTGEAFATSNEGLMSVADLDGRLLFNVLITAPNFPNVETLDMMIKSLRYISGRREFERMESGNNRKKELDSFWLDCGGSKDRTRDLIRIYYRRVQEANYYFSSYTEGWKTDRGLMHIIFGSPNRIKRDPFGEQWIYGEENNINSMSFRFDRSASVLSDNHYVLERNPLYRTDWDRAVTAWRNGRVFQE